MAVEEKNVWYLGDPSFVVIEKFMDLLKQCWQWVYILEKRYS